MKSLYTLRLISLVMVLSLLLTGGILSIAAEEESSHTLWSYDESLDVVYAQFPDGDTREYFPITKLSPRLRFVGNRYYRYAGFVRMDGDLCTVKSPSHKSEFIQLDNGISMTTRQGIGTLSALANGQDISLYRLYASVGYYATTSQQLLSDLRALPEKDGVSYTLFELKDIHCYEILGVEQEQWYGIVEAYIFETEEGLFYADPRSLPDSCFGADAELLPKTTASLLLIPLDESLSEDVYNVVSRLDLYYEKYSSEEDTDYDYEDTTRGLVLAAVIVMGILCPIAPITLGLCLPHSKNLGRKKRWYTLTVAGGVWLAMGVLLLVLMCTIM